jgi:tetratricopeptide (TPR) repeat protein
VTVLVVLVLGVPALAWILWPILRRGDGRASLLPLPPDAREGLREDKGSVLLALRELEFEHGAGHVSDADYAELRARYEGEAATIITELDRLGEPRAPVPPPEPAPAAPRSAWRHPLVLAGSAAGLVFFGVALGVLVVRYTEPDRSMSGPAMPGKGMPGQGMPGQSMPGTSDAPSMANAPRGPVTPEMLQGMLQAARQSLFAGRLNEAVSAYQAVLKRDPKNVDALTHLGLVLVLGAGPQHADQSLEMFDKALAIQPDYPPALLYRGHVLLEVKKDQAVAIKSWERFVAVVPPGEDRDKVQQLIAQARAPVEGRRERR